MYEVTKRKFFSSAHFLRGYKGACENIHGHNWEVELSVIGDSLDELGLLLDFHLLDKLMEEVLSLLDHKVINDIPPFDKINPSAENIAEFIAKEIDKRLKLKYKNIIGVSKCTVKENPTSIATYYCRDIICQKRQNRV